MDSLFVYFATSQSSKATGKTHASNQDLKLVMSRTEYNDSCVNTGSIGVNGYQTICVSAPAKKEEKTVSQLLYQV